MDAAHFTKVWKYFRMYSLRKDIIFKHYGPEEFNIYWINSKTSVPYKEGHIVDSFQDDLPKVELDQYPEEEFSETLMVSDPRQRVIGSRLYGPSLLLDELMGEEEVDTSPDSKFYKLCRMVHGIAEGTDELKDQLPLNFHMHLLNAINFNKGWYLGHELTQRTFHTGVLRKVTLPFLVTNDGIVNVFKDIFDPYSNFNEQFEFQNNELAGKFILNSDYKKIGRVITHVNNIGIGLFSLNKLDDINFIQYEDREDLESLYWTPQWMKNYIPTKNPQDIADNRDLSINPKEQYKLMVKDRENDLPS